MNKSYKNSGLFSDHYLSDKLPNFNVWQVESSELGKVHNKIKTIYQKTKTELPDLSESALEERFIRPILRALGHVYEVQPPLIGIAEGMKKPDYAFFESGEVRAKAQKVSGKEEFFKRTLAIGEAKPWGRPLDKKLKTAKDPFEIQNPSLQMSRYLWVTGTKWGILTDGCFWRLYERETSKRIDIYYEINLQALLEQGTISDFKYFYLFFNKGALTRGTDGLCLLDKIYQGSIDYKEAVSGELKGNVYQALRILAEGFLKNPTNNLSPDSLQDIHDNSLVFLYRLLFILYAEYRDLLPMDNLIYRDSYSLYALKREIAEKIDTKAALSQTMSHYHGKLKELFEVINIGNKELGVPPYNGGLFDPEKHKFLEKYRVGDAYLAQVVDLLSRSSDKAFVDYSSLEIRHLGSIYEGLLEYKLRVAEEDMIAIKEKGREKWVPAVKAKRSAKIFDEVEKSEVYLTTDKGERKATGSYYTPDYIVKYIVENTVGPLINEKKRLVQQRVKELEDKAKSSRGYNQEYYKKQLREAENSLIDEILSLKVLDPAMGSGHFLVEATDYIARALVGVLSGEVSPEEEQEKVASEVKERAAVYTAETMEEEDIRWARREVIEKCIFGVDLNPLAVELAKLSLWLSTVAKDRPLNFLDHHLRCGNSLIGANIEDLASLPDLKKKKAAGVGAPVQLGLFESIFKEKVNLLLGAFAQIESMPSDTVEQIRKKGEFYQDFRKIVSRFQDVADVWTSIYFENEVDFGEYQALQDNLREIDSEWERLKEEPWFKKAKEIAREKHFFHWELEFPEVFFEGNQRKENPGFDAVVGNPPWGADLDRHEKTFYKVKFGDIIVRMVDSYMFFLTEGITLTRKGGCEGQIVPNPFLTQVDMKKFRRFFLSKTRIKNILNLGDGVFGFEIANPCCIFIVQNGDLAEGEVKPILVGDLTSYNPLEKESAVIQGAIDYVKIPKMFYENFPDSFPLITKGFGLANLKLRFSSNEFLVLRSILDGEIQRGISADLNDAFLISKELIGAFNFEKEKCLPVITGHNVSRFSLHHAGEHVIYTTRSDEINDFPNIGSYLANFRSRITCKEVKENKHPWYALHRPRESKIFDSPKLVGLTTSDQLIITVDLKQNYYVMDNLYVIHLSNRVLYSYKFILGLLNSKLLNALYKLSAQEENRVLPQVKAENLYPLPIHRISFTTPPSERQERVEKAKQLYCEALKRSKGQPHEY